MDLTSVALGAVGKKIVDEAWDRGRALLARYFANSHEKTLAIAEARASDFLNRLAAKVERLEEQLGYDHDVIEKAMIDPAFGSMLQRALIHSAETSSETAHSILATLVAEKIRTDEESTKAVALLLAADVVSTLSGPHFAVLACPAVMRFGAPGFEAAPATQDDYITVCRERALELLRPFVHVPISDGDVLYLGATACGVIISTYFGKRIVPSWSFGEWQLELELFKTFLSSSPEAKVPWFSRVWFLEPTIVGDLIGLAALEATGVVKLGVSDWR